MDKVFRLLRCLALLISVIITTLVAGCGAPEPPLPSLTIPTPTVAVEAPRSTPTTAPTVAPVATSAPTAPPTQAERSGITLTVSIAPVARNTPDYDRDDWRHWLDEDGDCQNARQETLIAESQSRVAYKTNDRCRVASGDWFGVYTGKSFTDPSDLDVDHMVPLANAHRSGGWAWSKERKADYANDLSYANHLIAVQASANRRKSSNGPEEWKPPRREYWCQYAIDWASIKHNWGLTSTESEADSLQEMLATCDKTITLLRVIAEKAPTPSHTSTPIAKPATPIPPSGEQLRYDPHGPDRDCGDFDDWEEAQAFYIAAGGPDSDPHRLDGNKDGIACNSLIKN